MSNQDDRARIWEMGISSGSVRVVIQREYVCNSLIDVVRLIDYGLSMKRSKIFVEVNHEEVQTACASANGFLVMLYHIVEVS